MFNGAGRRGLTSVRNRAPQGASCLRPCCCAESLSGLKRLLNRLPSAVFEKSMPGRKFTLGDRATTYVKLGLEYSLGEALPEPANPFLLLVLQFRS